MGVEKVAGILGVAADEEHSRNLHRFHPLQQRLEMSFVSGHPSRQVGNGIKSSLLELGCQIHRVLEGLGRRSGDRDRGTGR